MKNEIIRLLQQNARMSAAAIGEILGISAAAAEAEIAKLEKDMKKQQKMSASLGVTANRISEELKYVQTPAYLNAMIRKMSREQTENHEEK